MEKNIMATDPIKQLDSQDMTPDRALEIVSRIQGPQGIEAAKREIDAQIEQRKMMLVKLQAQIEAFQAFSRTLGALENVWGLKTPAGQPMPAVVAGAQQSSGGEEVAKGFQEEKAKRVLEGKCAFKSSSMEGGKWCERMLNSKDEKRVGYCEIHAHALELLTDDSQVHSELKKVKRKGK
jgi:hypothetical protein